MRDTDAMPPSDTSLPAHSEAQHATQRVSAGTSHWYAVTMLLLVVHQIDAAYWQEWAMFGVPGGVQGFLVFNALAVGVLILGYREVLLGWAPRGSQRGGVRWARHCHGDAASWLCTVRPRRISPPTLDRRDRGLRDRRRGARLSIAAPGFRGPPVNSGVFPGLWGMVPSRDALPR